ncbi:MauE/DoxX family redox-associated membrane protein [Nonomuraea sp. SYSU D8015]|uniref:MauE/DoxX family redox-associated membrane protein n=1 Tax=Nonomuraea sp. SYSU D8015 TaxID=2593644 RepID=UPI0016603D6F|nr:MauE/DoxX family redox-associated membrane protein [Nonomuraea sp. SYSU D8015]
MDYAVLICRSLLGLVFAVSALSKLRGRAPFAEFATSIRRLGIVPRGSVTAAAAGILVAEVAVVVALAVPATVPAGFVLAAAVLAVFIGTISAAVRRGTTAPCLCFGASSRTLGPRHIVRNTILLAVSLAGGAGGVFAGAGPLEPAGLALGLFVAAVLTVLIIRMDDLVGLFADPP